MRFSKLFLIAVPCALWAQLGGSFLSGDLVRGGSALVTPGLVPTVSALGTLGQSDVSLSAGVFSRAGALGLSTSGANSITMAPGGTTMITLTSTGGATFYNPTAVSGVTGPFTIRAGAGQGSTALQTWRNNADAVLANIDVNGFINTGGIVVPYTAGTASMALVSAYAGLILSSNRKIAWTNDTNWLATQDLGIARNAAGVLEVNSGVAGTYRDLLSRSYIGTATSAATLANSQFTFHAPSNTELVVTLKGSDGTNRSVTLTLAP